MLLEVIGVGGMGFVYRAKNFKSREDVALKLIPKDRFRSDEARERFSSEIRRELQVPGAARILLVGETEKSLYIASDYVKGRNLESMVEAGHAFSPHEVARIGAEIAAVLQGAHDKGAIHGALTPSTIVISDSGAAMLTDLGLGRRTDSEGKGILTGDERLGAIGFRSPEQTREIPQLDARADIYGLAAALYFLLSGHRPFTADTRLDLIRRIRWDDFKPLAEYRKDLPESLLKALARAMEKEPEKRFATAADFAAALQA
jgi:eukaryotic-like serine/threonine-protein kinase